MSERGQHWQAIVITVVLHLLPLLLLVHWVAMPPMLPPPEQDMRISLRLLAPATPPQPVEAVSYTHLTLPTILLV